MANRKTQDRLMAAVCNDDQQAAIRGINDALALGANLTHDHVEPLNRAAWNGSLHVVKHILQLGHTMSIEFQAQDHGTGETALHAAASNGHAEVLALLLQQPDAMTFLDRPDAVGWTALALAVMNKYPACVRTLLEAGANVDARCERHNAYTPLEEAIFNGDAVLVEMLLRAGANPDIPTWMGITARQRVHDPSYQHADVRALFKTG